MSQVMFGSLLGVILGLAWVLAGFWSMILVAFLAIIGALIGKFLDIQRLKEELIRFLSNQ
ncbi:DUF2273 domain-containing protein [Liquorilactobacillus sicerae]|uniref:DUF2273 domain-containing protein n=1 Tax=Liquorilactobacillus sicerae TaxID=1416943 RepID=UPI002480A4D7|nr:DUF2273 domain-containing protein [Liquorilactobacillus sicerae]